MGRTTYRTADISIAAYLFAQGAKVRSIQGRSFFLDVPRGIDAVSTALAFIGSPEAEYDQTVRVAKKVILEWNKTELVGRQGKWAIDGRMEIVSYLVWRGASIVGFEKVGSRGRHYRVYFDAEPEWCESVVESWPASAAKRFDEAVKSLKSMARSRF